MEVQLQDIPAQSIASYEANKVEDPTSAEYTGLIEAFNYFNDRLFESRLPRSLITLRANRNSYGFFCGKRFGDSNGTVVDEIALNPQYFKDCSIENILSTLAHEMCHLEQHTFGSPSREGYHNKEFAALMKRIGLHPSSTGSPGGKETGQRIDHYIVDGGPFSAACAELVSTGFAIKFADIKKDREKTPSKMKYSCVSCNICAWAKPNTYLICGDCQNPMIVGGVL
jgi:predicted SprT family Zn-dependent metalloprotease